MSQVKAQVMIRPAATRDMDNIFEYIQSDNQDAAEELLEEINEKIMALPDHPKLYRQGRVPDTREMVIRSKYVVVYTETTSLIRILRGLHAARQWP